MVPTSQYFYAPSRNEIIDRVDTNGFGFYSAKTFEELKVENPDLIQMSGKDAKAAYEAGFRTEPVEILLEEWDRALGCMPPMNWQGPTFMLSELVAGDIAQIYCRIGDRCFMFRDSKSLTPKEIGARCLPLILQ